MSIVFGSGWKCALVGAVGALLAGCASTPEPPHMRLGSIPFPGPLTLYVAADPQNLGAHRYEQWWERHDGPDETSRGIVYTCRAGFLDLSHVRESIDIVRYAHDQIARRLAPDTSGRPSGGSFTMDWADSRFEVIVHAPPWWDSVPEEHRSELLHEAAIRQAQRFAVIVGTWHELGTWYGQETIFPFSEKNSAFTWDDTTSHVVASIVAGSALRRTGVSWNAAVTAELHAMLDEFEPVGIADETDAVEAVHGVWWSGGTAVKRDLDTGLDCGVKTPWRVPHFAPCGEAPVARLELADLSSVAGRDLRDFFDVRIVPPRWMMRKAMGCTDCPASVNGEAELLAAIERLRGEVRKEFGPDADHP